ncbi:MAG: HAMP domain-containing sensor histidine kinase [Anaeromyxobacter sp.]
MRSAGTPPGRLRRALRALRPSRFEAPIAGALVVAAVLPLLGALWLATDLVKRNVAISLEPRVVDRLEGIPLLYGDLFQARKQLYQEQTRTLSRFLPEAPGRAKAYLAEAIERTPRLRRAAWYRADGTPVAEAEAAAPFEGGEFRPWTARARRADGGLLECTFAVEARFFAEVEEARMLAEQVRGLERFSTEVPRSYQLAFFVLLLGISAIAAVVGIWLARRTTKRVTRLVGAVQRLAAGDLNVRVDPDGARDEVHGLAVAFNEMVREVRESRDRIVYLEKISGWQEVARRLAHEIKNPLTPIQLAFQQLEARWKQSPEAFRKGDEKFGKLVEDAGQIVREEIATLQRLVAEFSSFAKLPEVKPDPADLGAFVDEFVKTSPQLGEQARLEVVRAAGPCPVRLDRALFRRVLANLCQNAIEASPPGKACIHLGVARTRDRGVLTVADEGPGIERALRERIFDPYFTTKGTGTGLGLAIVKKIVLQHGGEIQCGERPGGGASFTVALPLVADSPPASD